MFMIYANYLKRLRNNLWPIYVLKKLIFLHWKSHGFSRKKNKTRRSFFTAEKLHECADKPSFVVCDNLSSLYVAVKLKPPISASLPSRHWLTQTIGVASDRVYTAAQSPVRRWALTSPFHPYHLRGGIFSVALALRSPSADVISYPALWCSDFPRKLIRCTLPHSTLARCIIA